MKRRRLPYGLYYDAGFLTPTDVGEMGSWLHTLYPLWETRYSKHRPLPAGEVQRSLLRPVYWLGNWQFACLGYYHPPRRIQNCCVAAEPFPAFLQKHVSKIEKITRQQLKATDIPKNWKLNTCLVNYYGHKIDRDKRIDVARVGEHKDFEPGPVASLSIGERALFQFVESNRRGERNAVILQQWLDNGSLLIFGSYLWKEKYFHRVQRVDKRDKVELEDNLENFHTRRLNLTFRYVPEEHITSFSKLPADKKQDVLDYIVTLGRNSAYYRDQL